MKWPADCETVCTTYREQGFVVLPALFNAEQMGRLHENLRRYISDVVPQVPPMDVFYEDKSEKTNIRMLPRMSEHDEFFRQLLEDGVLREIAESIWKCPAVPRDVAFFNKPARIGEATPPHQDGFYFHLNPCEAMTFWLALDVVDEQNGCVRYVAGSHQLGMRDHARTKVLGFSQGIIDYGRESDLQAETAACVQPGDVIIHDALTIHRTDANHSERSRRALGVVYFSSRANVDHVASQAYQRQLAKDLASEGKI